jgi:ABC-2 type transport system ATP-binding protein
MTSPSAVAVLPLKVDGAQKKYGSVVALAGASLEVQPGKLVGLLGPNGAGKTTLIKAIAGRVSLDAGRIELFGRTLTPKDPRHEIGVVPQELAIYDKLTARENLEAFGRLYGVSGATLKERVDRALEWSNLQDRAGEMVKKFSGGMKRRLNIACSLLHAPKLVLLDEPTVGVDPQSRESIYEMLASLRATGVSVVLTTHHLEEAEQRCERIVIIDKGRIVASGTLAELVRTTLGEKRTAAITLEEPWPEGSMPPAGTEVDTADRRTLRAELDDLTARLPIVFQEIGRTGRRVSNVKMSGAALHEVFIALTGRELRE